MKMESGNQKTSMPAFVLRTLLKHLSKAEEHLTKAKEALSWNMENEVESYTIISGGMTLAAKRWKRRNNDVI